MSPRYGLLALLAVLAVPTPANAAECPQGGVCVPPADMQVFVKLLQDKQCQQTTTPTFTMDPITVVVDEEGRIYGSGADPKPYKVKMSWCNYQADGTGKVNLVAAMREPEQWGFRFKLKATMGVLAVEAVKRDPWTQAVDVGVLLEPFFLQSANVNVMVGIRSVGAGLGFDLTRNFGLYVGYATTFSEWRSNPYGGMWFAFW